jgi:transposase-like protein
MAEGRKIIRYSEAFKRQVVEELETGVVSSISEARRRYGIRGSLTVHRWIRRLGKNQILAKVVRVETPEDRNEIRELRRQVRDLEHALAQTRMKELLAEAQFEILCRQQGIQDVEGQKKKLDAELSRRRWSGPGRRVAAKE